MTELTTEQRTRVEDLVTALRSGEYLQGQNGLRVLLRDPETLEPNGKIGYCCEGVAFLRHGEELGYQLTIEDDGDMVASHADEDATDGIWSAFTVAPPRFWRDMGMLDETIHDRLIFRLPEGLVTLDEKRFWEEYSSLNDSGLTFAQIADLMEWQFLSDATRG